MDLYKDVLSGVIASAVISPCMAVIDLGIIKSQMNKKSLIVNVKNTIFNIRRYKGSVTTMSLVYGATYVTANVTNDLLCTSLVNIMSIAYKDIMYSRYFTDQKLRNWRSNVLFAVRDSMTIYGSYAFGPSYVYPIASQFITTPIHIYGMDLVTRPTATSTERLQRIASTYKEVCKGRVLRVIPSFVIGVAINNYIKTQKIEK